MQLYISSHIVACQPQIWKLNSINVSCLLAQRYRKEIYKHLKRHKSFNLGDRKTKKYKANLSWAELLSALPTAAIILPALVLSLLLWAFNSLPIVFSSWDTTEIIVFKDLTREVNFNFISIYRFATGWERLNFKTVIMLNYHIISHYFFIKVVLMLNYHISKVLVFLYRNGSNVKLPHK